MAAPGAECRAARAVGVLSEPELALTELNQLYATLLDHLGRIPVPQRDALRMAFGVAVGPQVAAP